MGWFAANKEILFIGIPAVFVTGGTSWYAKKSGASVPVTLLAGVGGGLGTIMLLRFIRRHLGGTPEQLPDQTMDVLPSAAQPVATLTADAAMGRVAEKEKLVAGPQATPTPTTTPAEVGSNVVDMKPGGMDMSAFGSTGSE